MSNGEVITWILFGLWYVCAGSVGVCIFKNTVGEKAPLGPAVFLFFFWPLVVIVWVFKQPWRRHIRDLVDTL